MNKVSILLLILIAVGLGCKPKALLTKSAYKSLVTGFEADDNTTATYDEVISYYDELSKKSPWVDVVDAGPTDCGEMLKAVIVSKDSKFDPAQVRAAGRSIIFVNNGIHPGEPCGVDASMMLARDLVYNEKYLSILDKVTFVFIPLYNVGGSLNRNSHSRANQVGPESYGFRGNAKNLDLNRDFIKGDSYNSRTFQALFTKWSPDVFIDNHTSNGADYQYVITLIATQKDKLNPILSQYMNETMLPKLYQEMEQDKYEMIPYVYSRGIPDMGIYGFMDYPRYSSGYAALHNTIGFISEAHMLKPYKDRVMATYHLMDNIAQFTSNHKDEILSKRRLARQQTIDQDEFALDWTLDGSSYDSLLFKGYEAKYKPSDISGQQRLYYDRKSPWVKYINYFNDFTPSLSVQKPKAYYIPQAYRDIVQRMQLNGVEVTTLSKDQSLSGQMYYIEDYKTSTSPYEGHYLHSNVKVKTVDMSIKARKGDFIITTSQPMNRYIIETLEPQAPDSWFAWNYFDGILMQKEYYSAYVFEDTASKLLASDKALKAKFDKKKAEDEGFANDGNAQLNFIYEHSPHYEPTHNLYPVARLNSLDFE